MLLRAGLVDEIHLLVHPFLFGSATQKGFFNDLAAEGEDAIALSLIGSQVKAKDVLLLSYAVSK